MKKNVRSDRETVAATPPSLRWYQRDAVAAVHEHLRARRGNPLVVLPTGAGKSWVIARICTDTVACEGRRVIVLAHRKELLEQNADKIRRLLEANAVADRAGCVKTSAARGEETRAELRGVGTPHVSSLGSALEDAPSHAHSEVTPRAPLVGVYSAGLGRRDAEAPILVAGIQSVWNRAAEIGGVDLVLVDEAHLIPPGGDGMYRRFLTDLRALRPDLFVVGLTATPYRTGSGELHGPDQLFTGIVYEIGVRELIEEGFLSPLVSRGGTRVADTSRLRVRGGEFVAGELDRLMSNEQLVDTACREILELTRDRQKCLLFASGVRHGGLLTEKMRALGAHCELVTGETPDEERTRILRAFLEGDLRYLSNCDVLTTGFDAPAVDAIALLRPTRSAGLYYQMVGRGLRVHPGKRNCLVLDYGGNVLRHGPIDRIVVPESVPLEEDAPGQLESNEVEAREEKETVAKHDATAAVFEPLSNDRIEWHEITSISYEVWRKSGAPLDHPRSLRVVYRLVGGKTASEFIGVEQRGWARVRAADWWRARTGQELPGSAEDACREARAGRLREPSRVLLREHEDRRYPEVLSHQVRREAV